MISYVTNFIDLSDKPFIVKPKPQEDELLSSWLVRVALAHDTLPWSFMNLHFPEYHNIPFSRDLDVWAPDDLLNKIAIKSNHTFETIYALTLRSYIGTVFLKFNPSCGNAHFSYIKVKGRSNKLYGQKYCPICLEENEIPYFRKTWRLKSVDLCKIHQRKLLDRCCQCGKPISLYKFGKNGQGFMECWHCGSNLSKTKRFSI